MKRIFKKVEDIMDSDNGTSIFSLEFLLKMISVAYGGSLKLRQNFFNREILQTKQLPCPVISVGNLTVGGTGKTPVTMYVSRLFQQSGYQVVVVSRGYKGRAEKRGAVVSDGGTVLLGPADAGDEPYMMAKKLESVPIVVGRNRFKAGMLAVKHFTPDVIILDDAFQHWSLFRDIDLVLLDCRRPFGNQHLLPRGTLREPISALMRSDAVIMTRLNRVSASERESLRAKLKRYLPGKPVFGAFYVPNIQKPFQGTMEKIYKKSGTFSTYSSESLHGCRVFVFSGLADNQDFLQTVKSFKCVVKGAIEFPDHHSYSDMDAEYIIRLAKRAKADYLVTSEKDYVRIAHRNIWHFDLLVLGIEVSFGNDTHSFSNFIYNRFVEFKNNNTLENQETE